MRKAFMSNRGRGLTCLVALTVGACFALLGWRAAPDTFAAGAAIRNPQSAIHSPPYANALVHGRVLWKNSEDVAPGVPVLLRDAASRETVMQSTTDATGWYTMTIGVGSWLLDVPATAQYYGYAQELTALPHGEYVLDFAISPRPASDTLPTATPGSPALVPPTPAPGTTPSGPGALPANGQPADPRLFAALGLIALVIIAVGVLLLRRSRGA
jgi:hypothetical protein